MSKEHRRIVLGSTMYTAGGHESMVNAMADFSANLYTIATR